MKSFNKIILLSLTIMTICAPNTAAQGWLDKTLKKVDKALNEVDKALGLPVEQSSATTGYETATVKSFSTNVDFIIESCINDGKTLTLSYYLNNRGSELDVRVFGAEVNPFSNYKDKTRLLDDLGNEYEIVFNVVGKTSVANSQGINFVLPEGVKLKGEIRVANFNSRAKTLQLANIVGNIYDNTRKNPNNPTSPEYTSFNLVLKNVPVYTSQQVLSASKMLFKKEMPQVESQTEKDCVIKSVIVTANNTQINFSWTNLTGYNYVYIDNNKPAFLTVNGKKYPLTAYYGICSDKDLSYKYYNISKNTTMDFTLVFEKIPETNVLSLTWDDWLWNNIWLIDPPKAAVATTTATFTLTSEGVACLKKGVAFNAIPMSCPGFYDRYEVNLIEDEMEGDYNEINFYAGKEIVVTMSAPRFLRNYTVESATIYSPKV
jgi:hypothetical protein